MKNILKKLICIIFSITFVFTNVFVFAHESTDLYMVEKLHLLSNDTPVNNVNVIAFNEGKTTDENGVAEFDNVYPGDYSIKIIKDGKQYSQNINVHDSETIINVNLSDASVVTPDDKTKINKINPVNNNYLFISIGIVIFITFIILIVLISKNKIHLKINKRFKLQILGAISILTVIAVIVQILFLNTSIFNLNFKDKSSAATNNSLPIPLNIKKLEEDTSVLLNWDNVVGYLNNPGNAIDQKTQGYFIKWGPIDNNNNFISTFKKLTEDPAIQLQPLTPNQNYGAYIYTADYFGNLSQSSQLITFKTDSTHHDQVKAASTAFFDDFNTSSGPFDELKWNFAASGCVQAGQAGQFINAQYHAHNQIYDGYCDRGSVSSRPRTVFDFTNREGNIFFDQDGTQRRDDWYLDIQPASFGPYDLSGHIALNSNSPKHDTSGNASATTPIHSIRILQSGDNISIHRFDDTGWEVDAGYYGSLSGCHYGSNDYGNLGACSTDLSVYKNFRRHWQIKIKQNADANGNPIILNDPAGLNKPSPSVSISILIDGVNVYTASTIPFPESKAYLDNVLFSYNTPKSNEKTSLFHWDNFGFDGPSSPIDTLNYIDGIIGTGNSSTNSSNPIPVASTSTPLTKTIPIPDSLNNAKSARLMFTIQMPDNGSYSWSPSDNVTVNGNKFNFTNPRDVLAHPEFGGTDVGPSTYVPEQFIINISPTVLKSGTNTSNQITFNLTNAGILNTHIEVDFQKGQYSTYTPPTKIFSNLSVMPMNPDIGPNAVITDIGGYKNPSDPNGWGFTSGEFNGGWGGGSSIDPNNSQLGSISHPVGNDPQSGATKPYSGTIPIYIEAGNNLALEGMGVNIGISEYQIVVDRKSVFAKQTSADVFAPHVVDTFNLDSTKICNGIHEIFVLAFNPNGTASIPDYFQADINTNGQYNPIFIYVNNSGNSACTPLSTPTEAPLNIKPQYPVNNTTVTTIPITTLVPSTTPLRGDFNGDNVVNVKDLSILLSNLNSTNQTVINTYDLNNDGIINVKDLSIFLTLLK